MNSRPSAPDASPSTTDSDRETDVTLLVLACPHCGTGLDVTAERRVHVCGDCQRTLTPRFDGQGFVEIDRRPVRPCLRPATGARLVLLPVWSVEVDTTVFGAVGAALPSEVRIPAVGVGRLSILLQFARNLTRAPVGVAPWAGVELSPEPAEVAAEDAFVLAETVVLRHLDHWPGDDALESLEIPLGAVHLLDWPCAIRGGEVIELVAGLSVHRALLEEVDLVDRTQELAAAMEAIGVGPA